MPSMESKDPDTLLKEGREMLAERPATAIAYLERGLELKPEHPQAIPALVSLAEAYQAIKRFRECGFLLESCVELDPKNLDHHVRLSAFRLTRAHYRKAAEGLRAYLNAGGSPAH